MEDVGAEDDGAVGDGEVSRMTLVIPREHKLAGLTRRVAVAGGEAAPLFEVAGAAFGDGSVAIGGGVEAGWSATLVSAWPGSGSALWSSC